MTKEQKEHWQYRTAVASFAAAVLFGIVGIIVSPTNDVAAGTLILISQFLLLTASIFGIDYKWNKNQSL